MRATINVDDELFEKARAYTGLEQESEVFAVALKALIAHRAAQELAKLGGTEPQLQPIPRRRSA